METVTISKKEYERLKALDKVDWSFVGEVKETLKEYKSGKAIKC